MKKLWFAIGVLTYYVNKMRKALLRYADENNRETAAAFADIRDAFTAWDKAITKAFKERDAVFIRRGERVPEGRVVWHD